MIYQKGGGEFFCFCCFQAESVGLEECCGSVVRGQAAMVVTVEQLVLAEMASKLLVDNMFSEESNLNCVRDRAVVVQGLPVGLLEVGVDDLLLPYVSKHTRSDGQVD